MILCITGMHRSGTSLVASWLERCGLTIHDGRYWGPSVGNPKGHFEDKDFVDLHSSTVLAHSPKSHGWKIFSEDSLTFDTHGVSRAIELVDHRNRKYGRWGWKDPRSVNFLQQWKAIIPKLGVLLVWRPCGEVASSLVRRSRRMKQAHLEISLLESVKLWVSHNERICKYKQQHHGDTVLVPLEYVIGRDGTTLDLLNDTFQLNLEYHPVHDVYHPALLHSESTSLIAQLLSLWYGSSRVEKRLQDLSDMHPPKARN